MKQRSQGFTLIEMIVAFTIASTLALTLYGFFHISLRTYNTSKQDTQFTKKLILIQNLLQNNLHSLYNPLFLSETHFIGQPQRLQFTSIYKDHRGTFLRNISLYLKPKQIELIISSHNGANSQILLQQTLKHIESPTLLYHYPSIPNWHTYPSHIKLSFLQTSTQKPFELIFNVLHPLKQHKGDS